MAPGAVAWVACFLGIALQAHAQIRVMTPDWLVKEFAASNGRIEGSTATFGAPFYGDRVLGRLVYGESLHNHTHCSENDYVVPAPETEMGEGGYEQVKLINIILVRRGRCSFTTKVRVAYEKGAHAVLIVDRQDSELKSSDLKNIIVADDGFGDKIHIPSVLISKQDGNRLIQATMAKRNQVVVELAWDLPTDHVVNTDMWMSSASQESLKFLQEFSGKRRVLNQVVQFTPHYVVFGMDGTDPKVYNELCSDHSGQFCAEDPDGAGPVTGKEVLEEDVRQLCIHEMYKVARSSLNDMMAGKQTVEYAEKYWDYMEKFADRCPIDGTDRRHRFGIKCSTMLMDEVGIDTQRIVQCAHDTMKEKLKHERENPAWSPRALRINGWRYSGILDADLVTRAICSGFIRQPEECKDLIKPRNPFEKYDPSATKEARGVTFGTLLLWLLLTICCSFGGLLLYKRYLKKEMRTTLREEVMLEVQAQMGEYNKMHG